MNIIVFVGPSLAPVEAQQELEAVYRPPVAQGDVYRAAQAGVEAMVLIDGEFDQVPAVWHKEILWAMSRGIHVYGAASMGALRAAELCRFGMEGVGKIFEAYRNGVLEDDDEVAVAHLNMAANYRPTSEAMVNIRFTLEKAQNRSVIGWHTRNLLERAAKAMFFPTRSYPAMVEIAGRNGCDRTELAEFSQWWPRGSIDQKRSDAIAALRLVRQRHAATYPRKQVEYKFCYTTFWRHLVETAEVSAPIEEGLSLPLQAVLDELWLNPGDCLAAYQAASRPDLPAANSFRQRILEQLRRSGRYEELVFCAQQKQAALAANGLNDRGEGNEEIETEALLSWYLAHPETDAHNGAFLELARANWREFLRALIRHRYYETLRSP